MTDTVFGGLVTGNDVEEAAFATLKLWTPTYLEWIERKTGRPSGSLQQPRSWVTSADVERWPEEQLPSVLILNTGLAEEPARDGTGTYRAKFALGAAVIVSGRDRDGTDELAKVYPAMIRAIMVHKPSLGGFATAVEWVDERYDVLAPRNRRQLAAGQIVFRIDVADVVTTKAGPQIPPVEPASPVPDDPSVETTEIQVNATEEIG